MKNSNFIIEASHIHKRFEAEGHIIPVLDDISLSIEAGEFFILLGPSGSGKSTLLRIIAGLLEASSGKVSSRAKRIGFIFQNFALLPWLTVEDNIGFGLKMSGVPEKKWRTIARELIDEVGLNGFEKNFPRQLSGGMKQRVGIARALAIEPDIIFLDEPFSALDSFTAEKLRQDLLSIWAKKKITMVMVTHLTEEAVFLADRIAVLSPCPAKIESLTINKLKRPRNQRTPEFFKLVDKLREIIA